MKNMKNMKKRKKKKNIMIKKWNYKMYDFGTSYM